MKARRDLPGPPQNLRERAEKLLATTRGKVAQMPLEDVQKLVHELQVHQIELEMQNDELRRTQLELEAARERLILPYDAAPVGFFTLDARGVIHEANLAAAQLLNVDRVNLTGQKLTHFITPESQDVFYLCRRKLVSTGEKQTCELRMLKTGGGQFIARLQIVVENTGPEPAGRCLVMMSDITERKLAEDALRQSEERFRALTTASSDVIYHLSADWTLMLRLDGRDLVADTNTPKRNWLQEYIHPDDQPRVAEVINEAIRTKSVAELEHRFLHKDGSTGWSYSRTVPLLDANGEITGWFGAASDITARKQAEARLETFAEATFEGIVESEAGRIIDCNEQFARMAGCSMAELKGAEIASLIALEDRERVFANIRDGREQATEHVMLRKDGTRFIVESHGKPVAPGSSRRLTAIRDITGRKQAEEKLRRLNRTLHALSRSSHAVLRATTESTYLAEVCRIIVEDCGHAMVWVGFAENDDARTVRPAAWAGFEKGYLDTLQISWADTKHGRGPTGTAIRTGQVCLCRNMQSDPQSVPWRAEALKRGYRSSAAFPLPAEGSAFGALTIYSPQPDGFDEEEVQLLTELAGDFALGITTLRLRAALREREEQLRLFVDHAPAAIAMFDTQMRYIAASRRWKSDYGLPGKLQGRCHYDLFPDISQRWRKIHRRCLAGAVERADEDEFVRADGSVNWIHWEIHPWEASSGVIGGIIIFSEDITKRKQAEDALRKAHDELEQRVQERTRALAETNKALYRSEHALADFFSHAPIGLVWLSAGGIIVRVNRAQVDMLGCEVEHCFGHSFNEFLVEPSQGNDLLRRLAVKDTISNLRMPLRCKDGTIRHTLVNANSIWSDKRLHYSSLILRDITDRIALENEILQVGEREQRRIAQDLHDGLGQVLVGAAYLTSNLRKDLAARSSPEGRQSGRILELINEAITQTRDLAHGLHPVEPEPNGLMLALRALAARTQKMFQINCKFKCPQPVLIRDNAVSTHLFRIAQEAVTNSIKHGKPGRIKIGLTRTPGRINLAIRDDGSGLPARRRKKPGVGLRIMQYRAGLIGGSLAVQKETGGGVAVVCTVHFSGNGNLNQSRKAAPKQEN